MPKTPALRNLLILAALACFSGAPLWAREVSVFVVDADIDLPLEGALVHLGDGSEYVCDADGRAVITVPSGGQVSVQVTYPGYETGRLVIPAEGDSFRLGLSLGGLVEGRELVIEAARPEMSETRSGRSVGISGEALERSAQIGLIEDVMTAIKLLPGVGYTGMFNARPSIRGGSPGDLMAVLDGFYIENPYHWGGGFSIFDPHMVAGAQLSHGVFSSRYGHTISGLLEVSSKKASADYAELELGVSTSAVNLNAALPLGGKGGLMLMGKVTYWDPFVWLLKQVSSKVDNESLEMINAVTTAPYIRSAAASFNYRFNADLELNAMAFVGADGVGAEYLNESSDPAVAYKSNMAFSWDNLKTFLITGVSFNPRPSMVLRATLGAGYDESLVDADISYDYLRVHLEDEDPPIDPPIEYELGKDDLGMYYAGTESAANVQGRVDFDVSLGRGFLFTLGVQELFSRNGEEMEGRFFREEVNLDPGNGVPLGEYVHYPFGGKLRDVRNQRFNSSAYVLTEYSSPGGRLGAELGLRVDHFYLRGEDFAVLAKPALNPRLNLDVNVLRNKGIFESLDITAGTGLFSSMNDSVAVVTSQNGLGDFELRPNRSWTSVLGLKSDFRGGWSFNIEGYVKYVYDRAYNDGNPLFGEPGEPPTVFRFNGEGRVWGFDLMLQKFDSRYWDGWLSYTFTHAKYHEPERFEDGYGGNAQTEDTGWYYPFFHRFHNLNLVLNFKPTKRINIYTRLGLASGRPKPETGKIEAYDVYVLDEDGNVKYNGGSPLVITRYRRDSHYSDSSRTTWSIPWDVKFSYTIFNPRSKVQTEIYLAAENLFSLFYVAQANTSFNTYTGKEDTGSDSASYEMPVPMVSVGYKWTF